MAATLRDWLAQLDAGGYPPAVADLNTAATPPDHNAELRRRLAEPDLDFNPFRPR